MAWFLGRRLVAVGCVCVSLVLPGCYGDEPPDDGDLGAADAGIAPVPIANGIGTVGDNGPVRPPPNSAKNIKLDNLVQLALPSGWTQSGTAVATNYNANITVTTPYYNFNLGNAGITVRTAADGTVTSVNGTAQISMPARNTFAGLGIGSPLSGSFGWDYGGNLPQLGLPLPTANKVAYVGINAGFSSSFGTGAFTVSAGAVNAAVAVDPADPGFYVTGPMANLTGIALSEHGLIPFQPQTTWGFDAADNDMPTFTGQSWVAGEIPLEELPVVISGDVTTRYTGWNGQSALDKTAFPRAVGINGTLSLGWDFLDGQFTLEVPLAHASGYIDVLPKQLKGKAAVSGTTKSMGFLPTWIPVLMTTASTSVAGFVDTTDVSHNHIDAQTDFTVQTSALGTAIGLPMYDLKLAQGTMHVDRMGFRFRGEAQINLTPQLASADAIVTACFGGDPKACLADDQSGHPIMGSKAWIVRAEGAATLVGVPLATMTALTDATGISISADYKTTGQDVMMTGTIKPGPQVAVTGSANFSVDLTPLNGALGAVVSGAICGYNKITDAVKCGVDVVNFADELHCGKPSCSWSWKHGLRCKSLSCSLKVPRTCDDVSNPKTCSPAGNNFNLGSVQGAVAVTINNSGISGRVSGKFCATGSGCSSFSDKGTLSFSSVTSPKICFSTQELSPSLPAGTFCGSL